jgi:hypothetical protein
MSSIRRARLCTTRRGVAETGATVFDAELFGTRRFQIGRQIGACKTIK